MPAVHGTLRWVYGYGSLIWRADFPYRDRCRAVVRGWSRRFWQGSHDHRGTADAPGRVVTLVAQPGEACVGVAYRVDEAVFAHLDHREKNGYERCDVAIGLADGRRVQGVTYVAPAHNPAYLGPASLDDIAAQIVRSCGPSGSNVDYLLELASALVRLDTEDGHVRALAERVAAATG